MYSCKLKPAEYIFYYHKLLLLNRVLSLATTFILLLHISETHIVLLTPLHLHSSTSTFTYRPTLITGNPVARIVMYVSANWDM